MRKALRRNPSRAATASSATIPAPVLGWDTESPPAAMKRGAAVQLVNWIPRASKCELRRGYVDHATGATDPVESLIVWRGDAAGDVMFACTGSDIIDCTDEGGLGAPAWASATSARWDYTNFANDAGAFAVAANGADIPLRYDGTDFAELTITGSSGAITLDPADLHGVILHKRRLWFIEKNTLRAWYLQTNAIQGDAHLWDFGPNFSKGGRLKALGTWSIDGGSGMDDVLVAYTSEGQLAIYQGLDPDSAADWSLVGVFDVAKPLGNRPLIKWGADLALVTEDGILPMTQALSKDREEARKNAITARVASAFSDAAADYGSNYGWGAVLYSGRGSLVVFNVPTNELTDAEQYVQSIESGGWCRFTGLPAICWEVANGSIYFGTADGVYHWDVGSSDNGETITADVTPAFSDFGNRAVTKQFTMARALLKAPSNVRPALEMLVDYEKRVPTAVPTVVEGGDVSADDDNETRREWTSVNGNGYAGAPTMRVELISTPDVERILVGGSDRLLTQTAGDFIITRPDEPLDVQVELLGWDVMFEAGAPL